MGVRDRLTQLRKVFGTSVPPQIQAGEAAAGMGPTRPFSPGEPIGPYDGYGRVPRARDFVTSYNIATRPRTHERVAFDTLKGLIEAYDVAQMCIWHRIDSIRALDWSLVPARGFSGDADAAIDLGMRALEKPDRQTPFAAWLAKWLYDTLAYDAGALYRLRNRRGDAIGLSVVDGTTIAPLLDYWGRTPQSPAEAYVQYVQGLPWNWLTTDDLIYQPFRPRTNSPYGVAPLETILLNANTDLRFQAYFLQRFTEGNVPAAFASAPETWTPQQIEEFQTYWDSFMLGDQAAKAQIKWMPGGSSLAWSNEKDFSDHFSLFLMRKTCAAYHVVPSDLGFTESVNRSSGETQADVQHRVGDLPLVAHIQGILTHFLQDDLGLPLQFTFDTGQEKEDRLTLAQAWQIYIESGMASPDEAREQLLGLPGDPRRPTPRFFSTARLGPVPLLAIDGVAGKVDPETFGPAEDQPVLYQPYVPPPGVVPAAGTTDEKASQAAEDAYQVQVRDQLQAEDGGQPVTKDGAAAAPAAGITSATGITGYDLVGQDDEDDDEAEGREQLVKSELAAFRSFRKARRRQGQWRDFEFRHVDPLRAHRLNDAGRLAVRKDAGQVAVAGLAVQAADTGRVLMLQRALDDDDPAAGTWEFPGGHLEGEETPLQGAWREWAEETACIPPPGEKAGTWTAGDGIYQGIVWTVESETAVPVNGARDTVANPDDPDGDQVEAIAWWDPDQLADNPAARPELLASLPDVLAALGVEPNDGEDDGEVVKGLPKVSLPAVWPGWLLDLDTVAYWSPRLAQACLAAVSSRSLVVGWLSTRPVSDESTKPKRLKALAALAKAWLRQQRTIDDLQAPIEEAVRGARTDGYAIGVASAHAATDAHQAAAAAGSIAADMGDWTPGASDVARELVGELGDGQGLASMLDQAGIAIKSVADSRLDDLARALAQGFEAGSSVEELTQAVADVLSDPSKADMVVATELARASNTAAVRVYQQRGVEHVRWATADDDRVCPVCAANEAAGPRRLGHAFPSGDAQPPAHPRDRCAVVPA